MHAERDWTSKLLLIQSYCDLRSLTSIVKLNVKIGERHSLGITVWVFGLVFDIGGVVIVVIVVAFQHKEIKLL